MRNFLFGIAASIIFVQSMAAFSQTEEPPGLWECYRLAIGNYPLQGNIERHEKIGGLKQANIDAAWYPQLSLFGQAQYQSDVTKIDIDLELPGGASPAFPEMAKDQYKAGISLKQLIWDGGASAHRGDVEEMQTKIEVQSVKVDLYSLLEKVNRYYFNLLMLSKREESLETARSSLGSNIKMLSSLVENGVMLRSNLEILEAEKLRLDQQEEEITAMKKAAAQSLSELTGVVIPFDAQLPKPELRIDNGNAITGFRPEYELFDLSRENIERSKGLNDSKYMPKFALFGQLAYGRPGLNMFSEEFDSYWIVGVQASWSFWNWGTPQRESEILDINAELIRAKKESFTQNLSVAAKYYINSISKIERQLEQDDEIIALRKKIAKESEIRLKNGIITSTEYLMEFNASVSAELEREIRKIELLSLKTEYLTLIGKINQ